MAKQTSKEETLRDLDVQIAFLSALAVAVGINIYITLGYKDLTINEKKSRFSIKKLFKMSVLSASIFLIVTIYFYISAFEAYEQNPSRVTFNFYMASVLSLIAQSIRWSTLLQHPDEIFGSEDII